MKILPNPHVRHAKKEDLNRIAELWVSEMQYHNTLDPRFFDLTQIDARNYISELERSMQNLPVFVLVISAKIQGFASIDEASNGIANCNDVPFCRIGDLVIARNYGPGVRKRIMSAVKEWAKQEGYTRIDLKIHVKDKWALDYCQMTGLEENFRDMTLWVE